MSRARARSASRSPYVSNEGGGGFASDAGGAGDVVGRIACEREEVGDAVGGDAESFVDSVGVDDGVADGVVEEDAGVDELHEVFVGGDDDDAPSGGVGASGVCGDEVVGFESGLFGSGDSECVGDDSSGGHLDSQGLGGFLAGGFVVWVDAVTEGGARRVEEGGGVCGLEVVEEALEDGAESAQGAGRHAVAAGKGGHGVEGAEEAVGAVKEDESGRCVVVVGEGALSQIGHNGHVGAGAGGEQVGGGGKQE